MTLWDKIKIWWRGVRPTITELEGGSGWRRQYQNPDYPPARERFIALVRKPFVKWLLGAAGTIVIAVIAGAILQWFGL